MSKNSILVGIKLRPFLAKEEQANCWKVVDNTIQLDNHSEPYVFDQLFDENVSNQLVFDKMAKHIVHSAMQGFNGTIFAYGQTSSGKTYTMIGDEDNPGVMMLAAKEIFKEIERITDRQFLLRVGYIEIYNEKIFDLLDKTNLDLKIHETAIGSVTVNCKEYVIQSEENMLEWLHNGNKERTVGGTNMNDRSSRSHAIFRIIIESRKIDRTEDDAITWSVLNLVDLAGSERADQTGATGTRLKEGGHINKSLMFLSNLIKRLSENEDAKYVSYRDSKLTRILQASLGGNALTSIICTIKPAAVEETVSTLNFAMRAKNIKNKPKVNESVSDATEMKRRERKIRELEEQLAEAQRLNESHIKVRELKNRIHNEVLKILTSNSLCNVRTREERRRTWCSGNTDDASAQNSRIPMNTAKSQANTLNVPRSRLPKPGGYFTPHITMRSRTDVIQAGNGKHPSPVTEEDFKPADEFDFESTFRDNATWDRCRTPEIECRRTSTLTPIASNNPILKLEIVENEFAALQEFTNSERNLAVEHDVLSAWKEKLEIVTQRKDELEAERVEYIKTKTEIDMLRHDMNESHARCNELQIANNRLEELQQIAKAEMEKRDQELAELRATSERLEKENREVVSLEFEFERHRSKAQQREIDLLGVLDEKNSEIGRLVKSINSAKEIKERTSGRSDVRHSMLHDQSENLDGSTNNNVCMKCIEYESIMANYQRIQTDFEQLTVEYNKLQASYKDAMKDNQATEMKLIDLEAMLEMERDGSKQLHRDIVSLRKQLECVQCEYAELDSENNTKTERCKELNQLVEVASEELRKLQVKCDALEDQQQSLASIQREYDAVQEKYKNLQEAYESLKNASSTEIELENVQERERLQSENDNLQSVIKELTERVEKAQKDLQDGVDLAKSHDLIITKLKGEINELLSEKESMCIDQKKLCSEKDSLQIQSDDLQKEYDDLSNQLIDALQENDTLRKQCLSLNNEIAECKDQKHSLECQITVLKAQMSESVSAPDSLMCASLRSSGLGMEKEIKLEKADLDEDLIKFLTFTESFEAIELQLMNGRSRLFTRLTEDESDVPAESSYKLLLKDVNEVRENTNITSSIDDGKVFMHGTLKHHTFQIMEFTPSTSKSCPEADKLDASNNIVDLLRSENAALQELLESTMGTAAELREQISRLTAELFEKSTYLERCSCDEYQKQIVDLERERDERKLLCEELENRIKGNENDKNRINITQNLADNTLEESKSDVNEVSNEIDDIRSKLVQLQKEHLVQIEEFKLKTKEADDWQKRTNTLQEQYEDLQATYKTLEAEAQTLKVSHEKQLIELDEAKQQLTQSIDNCNRLQLEFCDKLETSAAGYRENLRKYNREWEDGRDEYERQILSLEEQLQTEKDKCCCAVLEKNLDECNAQLQAAMNARDRFEIQLEENLLVSEERLKKINELDNAIVLLKTECESINVAKLCEESRTSELIEQVKKLEQQNAALQMEIETQKDIIGNQNSREEEFKRLRNANAELLSEKGKVNETIKIFSKGLSELKEDKVYLMKSMHKMQIDFEKNREISKQFHVMNLLAADLLSSHDKLVTEKADIEKQMNDAIKRLDENQSVHNAQIERIRAAEEALRSSYISAQAALTTERDDLQKSLVQLKEQERLNKNKSEEMQSKIKSMTMEICESNKLTLAYEKLVIEHEEVETQLIKANATNAVIEQSRRQLTDAIEVEKTKCGSNCNKQSAKIEELQAQLEEMDATIAKFQDLKNQLQIRNNELQSQLEEERSVLRKEKRTMQSTFDEINLKIESLRISNEKLKAAKTKLESELKDAQQIKIDNEVLRSQLAAQDDVIKNAELQKLTVVQQVALLKGELSETRAALTSKQIALENQREKLQSTISNLTAEKSLLEERISTMEALIKRFEGESIQCRKTPIDSANNSVELNGSASSGGSPRTRRSVERVYGESMHLKSNAVFTEDKTNVIQQKLLQKGTAARKNRRLSTHDERRNSYWSVAHCEMETMTDPTDNNCKCIELDKKLQECQRQLIISESQVVALNLEVKSNPLKAENVALIKRLENEQKNHQLELKKLKRSASEQKHRYQNLLEALAERKATCENQDSSISLLRPPIVMANVDTQTELTFGPTYDKLSSKYDDMKRLCQDRGAMIKTLQGKINEKENVLSPENGLSSSSENAQKLKMECEKLKQDLCVMQKKYDVAKQVLVSRKAEILKLRGSVSSNTSDLAVGRNLLD